MVFFNRLFKFRIFKFRTTLSEELDDLHNELNNLQQNLTKTRLLQQKWTKWFAIYAILLYLAASIFYYTLFLPQDIFDQFYAFAVSFGTAAILYVIHWFIRWYFRKSIQLKEEKLALFKERKQELIEEVKNKETYAVAKSLLEKYGETIAPQAQTPVLNGHSKDIHQNNSNKSSASSIHQKPLNSPSPNVYENGNQLMQTPVRDGCTRLAAGVTPGKLPRAILPPQRTFWGAVLDTIVGDGPSKRYALICKSCSSHNGMALEEEFEYMSYRCAYCNYFNSARKQKPVFHPNLLISSQSQSGMNTEHMDVSGTDSSDSNEPIVETRMTRRSIHVTKSNNNYNNGNRSRSVSMERKRAINSILTSSEESLSDKKK